MCVCVPAAAPFLLPLLDGIAAALWALAPLLLVLVTVLLGALFLTVRGLVALVAWPVRELLERRSDRLHNERMTDIRPHLRDQLATRRRVRLSVVPPKALEPARPQLMGPAVRVFATPRKELHR